MLMELEFGNVGFSRRRKTGVPGGKPSEQAENQQRAQLTNDAGPESTPGHTGVLTYAFKDKKRRN